MISLLTNLICILFSLSLQKDEVYLNLVLDFVPETVYRVARHFNKSKTTIPIIYVKVSLCVIMTAATVPIHMYMDSKQ